MNKINWQTLLSFYFCYEKILLSTWLQLPTILGFDIHLQAKVETLKFNQVRYRTLSLKAENYPLYIIFLIFHILEH